MNDVYLLIGGNIGDRIYFLNESIKKIEELCGEVKDKTVVYETEAWGNTNQAAFLNQVLRISTSLTPHELLRQVLAIEVSFGRVRQEKNGARTIDIDILYFNDIIISDEILTIPHPRIAIRKFVLIPLAEIAKNHIDPVHKISVKELLENCQDTLLAIKYTNHA
jgi:2-amino-4-hydroxy-6-hydroxymethyldihydropteridine diphosphokinase